MIALPCMLYSMDMTVLNLAVPQLAADLKPSASQLLWIIDIYGFMVAGFGANPVVILAVLTMRVLTRARATTAH